MIFYLYVKRSKKYVCKYESTILHLAELLDKMNYVRSLGMKAYIIGTDY